MSPVGPRSAASRAKKQKKAGANTVDELPEIPPPPEKPGLRTRLHTALAGDRGLRFVALVTPIVLFATGVLYVVAALAMGSRWKLAFDILIGGAKPDEAHKLSYLPAALLAFAGYALVPAIIGAAVAALVATTAAKRITTREAKKAVEDALSRRNV